MKSFIWVLEKPVPVPCWACCPVCKELTLLVSSDVLMQRAIPRVSSFLLTGSRLQSDFSGKKHREFIESAQLKYAAFFFFLICELDDALFIVKKSSGVLKSKVSVTLPAWTFWIIWSIWYRSPNASPKYTVHVLLKSLPAKSDELFLVLFFHPTRKKNMTCQAISTV